MVDRTVTLAYFLFSLMKLHEKSVWAVLVIIIDSLYLTSVQSQFVLYDLAALLLIIVVQFPKMLKLYSLSSSDQKPAENVDTYQNGNGVFLI